MDELRAHTGVSIEKETVEHKQVYGTAKTENLHDSGLWRIVLPTFIILSCCGLLAIPMLILVPLFVNSLDPNAAANLAQRPLTWIWSLMILIEAGVAVVIIQGLTKIFLTQAGNYRS